MSVTIVVDDPKGRQAVTAHIVSVGRSAVLQLRDNNPGQESKLRLDLRGKDADAVVKWFTMDGAQGAL